MNKNITDPKLKIYFLIFVSIVFVVLVVSSFKGFTTEPYYNSSATCHPSPGYLCSEPTLSTTGMLNLTLGQYTGLTLYHLQLACSASSNYANLHNQLFIFNNVTNILSSGSYTGASIPCYLANGTIFVDQNIGTRFSGFLWLNYTKTLVPPSDKNPWYTIKLANLNQINVT